MPDRPNVLLICTDQQRRDTMACYGNDFVQSPNVNALAEESFVFENCYVTVGVCSPARASLLTGLYPHTAGVIKNSVPLPESSPTIAELTPEGYNTAKFGKWHLGNDLIRQHGFDEWVATEDEHESNPTHTRREDRFLHSEYFEFLRSHGYEPHTRTDGGFCFFATTAEHVACRAFDVDIPRRQRGRFHPRKHRSTVVNVRDVL